MLESLRQATRQARGARAVKRCVEACDRLLSAPGESNSRHVATEALKALQAIPDDAKADWYDELASRYNPDPQQVLEAAQRYAQAQDPAALVRLTELAEPPRQELLRRLNRAPGGTSALLAMRSDLLEHLGEHPQWAAVDADMQHLLGSWFNPGFLQLRRVDWNAPASLLEWIADHEAVHAVHDWRDLRRRLQPPDRRCFAFFHPALPDEPLIFVEVALVPKMPDAVQPLLHPDQQPGDPDGFRVAAFYSISNCQPGLRGVNLGNFLIKQVVEELRKDFPQLKTFCTLSPIPGLVGWLKKTQQLPVELPAEAFGKGAAQAMQASLDRVREQLMPVWSAPSDDPQAAKVALDNRGAPAVSAALRHDLQRLAAYYLAHTTHLLAMRRGADSVARFHLNNGAQLERINWAADVSGKGIKQSLGLMVNYLYALDDIEAHHETFVAGEVCRARRIDQLLQA